MYCKIKNSPDSVRFVQIRDGTIVANKLRGDDVWVELRKLNLKENNRTYMH